MCYGTGSPASASTIVLAAAAKHVVQILELLDERRMNFTFPVNKTALLLFSGFSLLWQCLELEDNSKIIKDNQKTLTSLIEMLNQDNPTAGIEFLRIASSLVTLAVRCQTTPPVLESHTAATTLPNPMPAPTEIKSKSARKSLQAITSRFPSFAKQFRLDDASRRATVPLENTMAAVSPNQRSLSTLSLSSTRSTPVLPTYDLLRNQQTIDVPHHVNLDYFPIGEDDATTHSSSTATIQAKHLSNANLGDTSWEQLLSTMDTAGSNMFSGNLGSHACHPSMNGLSVSPGACNLSMSGSQEWGPGPPSLDDSWASLSAVDLSMNPNKAPVPQSVLSFSEESLTSGDDLVFSATGSNNGSTATNDSTDLSDIKSPAGGMSGFKGIAMPTGTALDDDYGFVSELEAKY